MSENMLDIRCPQCGEINRLPCVHCKRCGSKLDFDGAEQQMKAWATSSPAGSLRRRIVRTGLLGVVLLIFVLALWPADLPRRKLGEPLDGKRFHMKMELLTDALNHSKPASQIVTEEEMNAWLAEVVRNQPTTEGAKAQLMDSAVCFEVNRAQWLLLVKRGPMRFSAIYSAKANGSKLVLTGAKVGHLPLPGVLGSLYAATQDRIFRSPACRPYGRILRNLDGLEVRDGEMELLTRSGEP